jgi:hypothetical protein
MRRNKMFGCCWRGHGQEMGGVGGDRWATPAFLKKVKEELFENGLTSNRGMSSSALDIRVSKPLILCSRAIHDHCGVNVDCLKTE